MTDAEFLERLAAIVGAAHVLTQEDDKAGYLVEPRDLYRGRALAVVRPGATSEVAAVLVLEESWLGSKVLATFTREPVSSKYASWFSLILNVARPMKS